MVDDDRQPVEDSPPLGAARWAWPLAVGLVLFVVALQYRDGVLLGRHWLGGDNDFQNFPWHWWAREARPAGRLFEPVPEMSLGLPLWLEPQSGVWYPLNTALWPGLGPYAGFTFRIVLHYLLAAIGMLCLARSLGLSAAGAAAAAIVFTCGSFAVYQIPRVPPWQVVAWYPWIALCFVNGLRTGRWIWLPLAAALHAVQFLGGHPQFAVPMPVVCIGLGSLAQPEDRSWPARLMRAAVAYLVVAAAMLLMTAMMWLPATGAVAAGPRTGEVPLDWLTMWGCNFGEAMQAFLGGLAVPFKMEKASFASTAALVALSLAWGRGDRWRRWWLALALLGLALNWAIGNPLSRLLLEVPLVNRFRNPSRYGLLYAFAAAFLVGLMVDDAGRVDIRQWRGACAVAGAIVASAAVVVSVWPRLQLPPGLLLQAAVLGLLTVAGSLPPRRAQGLVIGVVTAELLWFGHGVNPAMTQREWLATEPHQVYAAAAEIVRDEGGAFLWWGDRLPTNIALLHGLRQPISYSGYPYPGNDQVQIVLFSHNPPAVLAAYGVSVVAAREEAGLALGLTPLRPVGTWWLFRNPLPVAEAYLPSTLLPLSSQTIEATLRDPGADPRRTVAVSDECWPPGYLPSVGGEILSITQARTAATVRTRSTSGTLLVLTRAWALGWQAAVDGRPVPTMRANLTLLAAPVPPGEHEVTFLYDANLGLEKSLAGRAWLLWLVALIAALVADRRRAGGGLRQRDALPTPTR